MNTLAKVLRSDSAAAILAFRPDELGTGAPPSSRPSLRAGSQAYRFPALDLPTGSAAISKAVTFPEVDELAVEFGGSVSGESEKTALEKAVREKTLQEARAAAQVEMNTQIDSLRKNLTETIGRVSGLANEMTVKLETEVVELALEIAKKVVTREINVDREIVLSVAKNALSKLHSRTLASIHLHPDDLAYIQEHRNKLNFHGSLELIEDATIAPGGCLIHTDTGDIDGRIESQFDEIGAGLLGAF